MKLLTAAQIKKLDALTIKNEPVSSLQLMERAATACVENITKSFDKTHAFLIFCGKGNNGGDGLAIARLLSKKGYECSVLILEGKTKGSTDYEKNLQQLKKSKSVKIFQVSKAPELITTKKYVIIDALLGTGFIGEMRNELIEVCNLINKLPFPVISIDIPSGLPADEIPGGFNLNNIVRATITLTFHVPKITMLGKEGAAFCGEISMLDIGLSVNDYLQMESRVSIILPFEAAHMLKARNRNSAKWNYGHALVIAGSQTKPGAAMLATRSCLKSGVGLCTLLSHPSVITKAIMHTPELMGYEFDEDTNLPKPEWIGKFDAIGVGPGCGTDENAMKILKWLLQITTSPLVIDADAINLLAENKTWLAMSTSPMILTPHFKEFCRLTGCPLEANQTEIDAYHLEYAAKFNAVILLKSAYTRIATPSGNMYINFTGNSGLAKAGSGDVLTGIITTLMAQQYTATEAAILGVCLHGLAADIALSVQSLETMMPSDVTNRLADAFKQLHQFENEA